MKYIICLIIMGYGYYTFTYALSLWKRKNKLGAFGVGFLTIVGSILSIMVIFIKALF